GGQWGKPGGGGAGVWHPPEDAGRVAKGPGRPRGGGETSPPKKRGPGGSPGSAGSSISGRGPEEDRHGDPAGRCDLLGNSGREDAPPPRTADAHRGTGDGAP